MDSAKVGVQRRIALILARGVEGGIKPKPFGRTAGS
jgi:hypothetical protein